MKVRYKDGGHYPKGAAGMLIATALQMAPAAINAVNEMTGPKPGTDEFGNIVMKNGGRTGGGHGGAGGEADSDDAVITDGRRYANGGGVDFDPRMLRYSDPNPMQRQHLLDQARYEIGLKGELNKEIHRRDREAFAQARQESKETGGTYMYPALDQEVTVLMDMLSKDQLQRDELSKKGKRRRTVNQILPFLLQGGLGMAGAGKVAQHQAEKLTGERPNFGQALRMVFGGQ